MTPRIVPARTVSVIPSTAMSSPNRFVTPSMTTGASIRPRRGPRWHRRGWPSRRARAAARCLRTSMTGSPRARQRLAVAAGRRRRRIGSGVPPRIPHGRGRDERSIGTGGYRPAHARRRRSISGITNGLATWLREGAAPACDDAGRPDRGIVRSCPTVRRPELDHRRPADPRAVAREAGLRYATDTRPGITRRRSGRGFTYRDAEGATIRDRETIGRIRRAGHPAGLDRRLDLPVAERPPPGDRPRRPRPQAVPLPRGAGSERRGHGQVRPDARVRRGAAAHPAPLRRGPRDARPVAREGPGGRRPAAGADAHPGRQRRVRAAQPVVRADDPARPARPHRGLGGAVPVPRQVRPAARGRACATGASPASSAAARTCPARSSSSTSTRTARSATSRPTTSTPTSARPPAATSRRRTSGRGPARCSPIGRFARSSRASASARRGGTSWRRSARPPTSSATRPAVARGQLRPPGGPRGVPRGSIRGALVEAAEEQSTPPTGATPAEEAAVRALLRQRLDDDAARSTGGRARARRPRSAAQRGSSGGGARSTGSENPISTAPGSPFGHPRPAAHRVDESAGDVHRDPRADRAGPGSRAGSWNRSSRSFAVSVPGPVEQPALDSLVLGADRDLEIRGAGRRASAMFAMRLRRAWARAFGSAAAGGGVPSRRSMILQSRPACGFDLRRRHPRRGSARSARGSRAPRRARGGSGRAGPRPPGTGARPRRTRRRRAPGAWPAGGRRRAPGPHCRRRSW